MGRAAEPQSCRDAEGRTEGGQRAEGRGQRAVGRGDGESCRATELQQVPVGVSEGPKHESSIHCDELVSLPKAVLTQCIGTLSPSKIDALNAALRLALDLSE